MMTADRLTGRFRLVSGKLFKIVWRAFLAAFLACVWSAPPAGASGGYVAVACLRRNADLCGVINEKGEWVVKPGYDQITDFSPNGRAVAVKHKRPGVIDIRGEWVIPPGFDRVDEEWSAGLIKVGRSDQRAGLIYGLADESGRVVVDPAFREIQAFGPNRLAGACDQESRCGFIDTRGAWVVPPVFDRVEAFSENGLAPAKRPGEELWGYINAAGAFVISPVFDAAFPFDGDRAKVSSGGLYSLINSKGQAVGKHKFTILGDFDSGGLTSAQKDTDGLFGLVNRSGAWVVPPTFERVFSFNGDNLAPAQAGGFFGFINRKGQWVIKPSFGNVDDFESRGSRAPAQLSGAWGLIDSEGRWVVNPDHLLLLNTGVTHGPIQVFAGNGRWGLMDENGRWLLEPILTASPYFASNGLSEAKVGKLYGFIDRFGNWVVEPSFQQVGVFRPVPAVPSSLSAPAAEDQAPPRDQPIRLTASSSRQIKARVKPKAEEGAEVEPRRRVKARQEPAATRIVLPDKPSAPGQASAETVKDSRPKAPAETDQLSPPLGYIPPADPAPVRRIRPSRPAPASPKPPPKAAEVDPPGGKEVSSSQADTAEANQDERAKLDNEASPAASQEDTPPNPDQARD